MTVADGTAILSSHVFGSCFYTRTLFNDTIFQGGNTAGDDRVEHMRYSRVAGSFDLNCPLDNAGNSVIGNIIETTASDGRLNTKIEDIETNFSDCVKHVQDIELVTLRLYVTQELQKHLADQCKHEVKETQKKDEVSMI